MRIVVIYQSKTGYSKEYAEWIAEALKAEVRDLKSAKKMDFSTCDWVIFGGGVYASRINGLKRLRELLGGQEGGRLSIFAVGASPPGQRNTGQLIEKNLKDWLRPVEFYYFQGGFDPEKLSPGMKLVIAGVKRVLGRKLKKHPETLTEDDHLFLEFFNSVHHHSDPGQIKDLVDFVETHIGQKDTP